MTSKINISVSHRFREVVERHGDTEWSNGTTTIEAETSSCGDLLFYVQNKGFGFSSSKSVRTKLDAETVRNLTEFLARHLELAEDLEQVRLALPKENEK